MNRLTDKEFGIVIQSLKFVKQMAEFSIKHKHGNNILQEGDEQEFDDIIAKLEEERKENK